MKPLAIAVIGAGIMGRQHVALLRGNPRCGAVAVVDPGAPAALWAASQELAHHSTVEELLAAGALDGAIVATPNDLHVSTAVALLEAGVPVLVEKPIAESLSAGERLAGKARETGVAVLIGHHRRHSAAIQAAQNLIAQGRLGRIVAIQSTTLLYKPKAYFEMEWRRGAAGGPILINLVHDVDSLRALAGEVKAVQAVSSSRIRGFEAEDTAAVILQFASGAVGTMLLSDTAVTPKSWEHTSGENPSYPHDPTEDCIFIAGTGGSLAVPTMRIWRQEGEPSWTRAFLHERAGLVQADPLVRQLDHFCDVIEHGAAPLVGAADALRTLAVTLAVKEAARSGSRIEVHI